MTFSIEEQKIVDLSHSWIFPASPSATGQSYQARLLRDRDLYFTLFRFDAPFQPPANVHEASGKRVFHLISMLRNIRRRHLYALSGWRATDAEADAAKDALSAWMHNNRETARECLLHAGALFSDVRSQTYKVSFDPYFFLIPIIYMWAYQKLSPDSDSGANIKPILRVDCGVDETLAKSSGKAY
ncbi:hypothetical protein Daus18300_009051 [Diaporthe australafricana]|uniref:Uncharacterized protein n=1 Tax=Diaporthe australafricana TaxID=127596 RepID=A0ABR3WG71_9PEZI